MKGDTEDIALPHPLNYWTVDPLARDEANDLCFGCKLDSGKVVGKSDYHAMVNTQFLSEISGHKIVQFLYRIQGSSELQPLQAAYSWKVLVVASGHDEYAEIFHLQPNLETISSARVVRVGSELILATYDPDGGNGGGCWDGYWWFDAAGPHQVDFSPVYKAIGEAVSRKTTAKATYSEMCWTIDLDQRQIHTGVQKADAPCHACGQLGSAKASFEIIHGVAKPTHVDFEYDPQE